MIISIFKIPAFTQRCYTKYIVHDWCFVYARNIPLRISKFVSVMLYDTFVSLVANVNVLDR